MDYVKLGSTGLDVSPLALGCMSFGDPARGGHQWVVREDEARLAAVASQVAAQIDLLAAREQLAVARHTVAQARVAAGEVLSGLSEPNGAPTVAHIERETAHLQARVRFWTNSTSRWRRTPGSTGLRNFTPSIVMK